MTRFGGSGRRVRRVAELKSRPLSRAVACSTTALGSFIHRTCGRAGSINSRCAQTACDRWESPQRIPQRKSLSLRSALLDAFCVATQWIASTLLAFSLRRATRLTKGTACNYTSYFQIWYHFFAGAAAASSSAASIIVLAITPYTSVQAAFTSGVKASPRPTSSVPSKAAPTSS